MAATGGQCGEAHEQVPQPGARGKNHHKANEGDGDGRPQVRFQDNRDYNQGNDGAEIDDRHPKLADSSAVVMYQRRQHNHQGNLRELAWLQSQIGDAKPAPRREEIGGVFNKEDADQGDDGAPKGRQGNLRVAPVIDRAEPQCQHDPNTGQHHLLDRHALKHRVAAEYHGYPGARHQHHAAKRQDECQQQ